jgi:iron complex outermembrane recepter protein
MELPSLIFSFRRPLGSAALVPVFVATSFVAVAQTPAQTDSTQRLDEVIIQANKPNPLASKSSEYVSKMPLRNLENPQVYHTVGQALLTEQLVYTVDDAVRNAPGLQPMWQATGRAGDGGSYYNSRGFIVQNNLRNGLGAAVTSLSDAVNLEKLEVIKGPSATLFGSTLTSYGGLLNRVTKKPYDRFGGDATLAGGNFGFHRASFDVNTPLGADKKVLVRLNSAYQYEDNFQSEGFNRSLAIAPSLIYRPTDRLSIHLDAELYRVRNVGKQIFFFYYPAAQLGASRADELPLDYRNSYMGSGLSQDSRSTNLFGQINYRIAPGFTSSTNVSFSRSFSEGVSPYFYLVPNAVATGDSTATGANYLARADQSTGNSRNTTIEVQQLFNGDFKLGSMRNRVVIGLDFLQINSNQNFFGSTFDIAPLSTPGFDFTAFNGSAMSALYAAGPPAFTYPITTKSNTYSAFASDVLNLTNRLSVLAALRIDRFDNQGGKVGGETLPFKQTGLSPKFGVVFQPVVDRVAVFANYQNSFNNKGSFQDTEGVTRNAKLEQANQIEAGVKLDAASGRVSATVSYYDIRVSNILRSTPTTLAPNAQTQNGTQLSKGVELSVIASPVRGFNVVAGFSYNDSEITRSSADVDGRRPATASSPYLANLWLSYRLTSTPLEGLGVGFGGNYASDNKILNSQYYGVFVLPAYTVLNASVFYEHRRFRVAAKVDNLTDEHYWIGYTTMNPQKLRSYVGSLTYKF